LSYGGTVLLSASSEHITTAVLLAQMTDTGFKATVQSFLLRKWPFPGTGQLNHGCKRNALRWPHAQVLTAYLHRATWHMIR
jgi:hypothetical protein